MLMGGTHVGTLVVNGSQIGSTSAAYLSGSGSLYSVWGLKQFDVAKLQSYTSLSIDASTSPQIVSRVKDVSAGFSSMGVYSVLIDYTGASPADLVRTKLASGSLARPYSAPAGLTLGFVEGANSGTTTFGGFQVDATSLIIRSVYAGDANLSGTVDSADFGSLVASFGLNANAYWWQGDFNYDGKVNTLDFNVLAGNFGKTLSAPALGSLIPEPAMLSTFVFGLLPLARCKMRVAKKALSSSRINTCAPRAAGK
jgi:hypothetical protein